MLLGGDGVNDGSGRVTPTPRGLYVYSIATGVWRRVDASRLPSPWLCDVSHISNHVAAALPPSCAIAARRATLSAQFGLLLLCNARAAAEGRAALSPGLLRHVWSALVPPLWRCGRLLVFRRTDATIGALDEASAERDALLMFDFWDSTWSRLARTPHAGDSVGRASALPAGIVPFACSGWPNMGVVRSTHPDYGWPEYRVVVHNTTRGPEYRGQDAAVFLSSAIPS